MYYVFITGYLFLLLKFCHCDSVWQLWLLQSPHCQISETTNYPGYTLRVLTALLGLPSFLNLGPKLDESTLNCSEYVVFRVKTNAAARACFSVHSGIQKKNRHRRLALIVRSKHGMCVQATYRPHPSHPQSHW